MLAYEIFLLFFDSELNEDNIVYCGFYNDVFYFHAFTRNSYHKEFSDVNSHNPVSGSKLHLIGILKRRFFSISFSNFLLAPDRTREKLRKYSKNA